MLTKSSRASLAFIGLEITAVLILISIGLLLKANMSVNEVDVLPLARQYADPTWIPGDWYLNQPAGYRELFQAVFGKLIVSWGFLATSILGRLICYGLVASGLVLIARKLELNLLMLLVAVSLFLYPNYYRQIASLNILPEDSVKWIVCSCMVIVIRLTLFRRSLNLRLSLLLLLIAIGLFFAGTKAWSGQGSIAGEWLVGGLEAKAVAYGLILLAIALMLRKRYRAMALILGIATSFHILVGVYAFLTFLGWLILKPLTRLPNKQEFGLIILLYLVGSSFAFKSIVEHFLTVNYVGSLQPSYIYVFVRLSHHLNPLSWTLWKWINLITHLVILAISVSIIWFKQPTERLSQQHIAQMELCEFTLISLIPFLLGIAIAPFDTQGRFLQYYPFRFGDIVLPLNTCLLFACATQQTLNHTRWHSRLLLLISCFLLTYITVNQMPIFRHQFQSLSQFPSQEQGVDQQWKDLCNWVRNNTPKNANLVSSPVEFDNITWITERPIIAKWKLMAQNKAGILEWYNRIRELGGDSLINKLKVSREQLTKGYNRLTTAQAKAIMLKYQADYLVTRIQHQLDIPVAYRNQSYVLYRKER
ncbi:hypothetical protein H6G41_29225 [Tolypothrix sp. FACHB-123]|uniref:DUF6798 domain-containing protein n=1 Tax=Tolypothrix sp. FACHB-123 TaxID=2692868 RepID=UPI0016895367|nr:DUF6798 domain-containing protein [Tolypothrix sp. FACHB-123]MBD2358642.1 hypothetical protein [Tolypothrix sp. FACHB-123]